VRNTNKILSLFVEGVETVSFLGIKRRVYEFSVDVSINVIVGMWHVTDQRVLGDQATYGPQDQRWNKREMLAAKMDKFLAVSVNGSDDNDWRC